MPEHPPEPAVDRPPEPPPERPQQRPPERPNVLEARGLGKTYGAGAAAVEALVDVDFTLERGEILVILGPSGSGKSTLLNILGGLDTPTRGEVRTIHPPARRPAAPSTPDAPALYPLPLHDEAALTRYRREHVGFVFQFYNLVPSLTARENVTLAVELVEHPMRAEDALDLVGLRDRLDHFPSELSGGEQQRVAIARAIAKRPALLLCDEPTGALDAKTGRLVLDAIRHVNETLGTACAVITHNAVIAAMGDRVVTMKDGHIADIHRNPTRVAPSALDW